MRLDELVTAIYDLQEEEVDTVFKATKERSRQLRQQRGAAISATLEPGARVFIAENVRPVRYAGARGIVRGKRASKWTVELDSGEQLVVGASAIRREEAS